jgi:hypothetical protein
MMKRIFLAASMTFLALGNTALACPEGQSKGAFGWCYPNIGGEVGNAWEKGKDELANFERDVRVLIETGKCGGDICDAFAAAVQFGEDQITDFGESLERAGERLEEGKPLDAVWHLQTDYFNNSQENAADAAKRSRVLLATGQVAASVYGGPGGAAAYTAWLTYNTTGNLNDALKAGIISGVSAAALASVSTINLEGAEGIVARSVLTGAISGAAVAASGGSDADIRAAVGMGVVAVMIREGYRELTELELDENRLKSSTGEAYCLAETPPPSYLASNTVSGCFAPPSAYKRNPDGTLALNKNNDPIVDFKKLDPDRPHVGVWAKADTGKLNVTAENSGFMTGVSRLPGWNAMAVAHDELSAQMNFDLLPGGIGIVPTVATIPPAVVVTYLGTGYQIHDSIRDTFVKRNQVDQEGSNPANSTNIATSSTSPTRPLTAKGAAFTVSEGGPTEKLHLFCGIEGSVPGDLSKRTDLLVSVSASGQARGVNRRVCEIQQLTDGVWYELGHAHHQLNYCHSIAERIARNRQNRGFSCFASTGIQMTEAR